MAPLGPGESDAGGAAAWTGDRPPEFPIRFLCGDDQGYVEGVEGQPLPVARVFGWFAAESLPSMALLTSHGRTLQANTIARQPRRDVVAAGAWSGRYAGFIAEFLLDDGEQPTAFLVGGRPIRLRLDGAFAAVRPHYAGLFDVQEVLHRQHIYGSGPPADVADELKEFALLSSGRILDFGCGNGDLIAHLLRNGKHVVGIELDEQRIRDALPRDIADRVTLYDGRRPLPFPDGSFDSIISTEVVEHVPDVAEFVPELARVLADSGRLLLTTPDATSIPSSFMTGTVPWHMLESTHINFFTPRSLCAMLASHFELETIYSLCSNRVSGVFIPGSIGAVLRKRT